MNTARLLESLGHHVDAVELPALDDAAYGQTTGSLFPVFLAREVDRWSAVLGREIQLSELEPFNAQMADGGRAVTGAQYLAGTEAANHYCRRLVTWWDPESPDGGWDILMTPQLGAPPPRIGELGPDSDPAHCFARMGVLADARGLYPRLSARENVVYHAMLQGMARDAAHARVDALAESLDMKPLLERRCEGFSQGERVKTALARALVHDPANIILDEPTNGLDVLSTRALREVLRHLASPAGGGKCIVLSSHIMQEVEKLCDTVVVVARGHAVVQGTVEELRARTGQSDFEEAFVQLAFGEHR